MTERRACMSFEKSRKALLAEMTKQAKGKDQDKVIPFPNNDVPDFLQKLDSFEERSRKKQLVAN